MSILINGASNTSGDGLENPSEQCWPTVFSRLINNSVVNLAMNGAGVDYIVYTTLTELAKKKFSGVIIAWPLLFRPLMCRRETNDLVNGNLNYSHYIYGDSKEYKDYCNLHFKYWTNEAYELKLALQKILLLQTYLKYNNYKYLFINSDSYNLQNWVSLSKLDHDTKLKYLDAFDHMNDQQVLDEECIIQNYYNQLDLTRYYQPMEFSITDECKSKNLFSEHTIHPTIEGHIHIANLIADLWD
jgi:hypothetical protein